MSGVNNNNPHRIVIAPTSEESDNDLPELEDSSLETSNNSSAFFPSTSSSLISSTSSTRVSTGLTWAEMIDVVSGHNNHRTYTRLTTLSMYPVGDSPDDFRGLTIGDSPATSSSSSSVSPSLSNSASSSSNSIHRPNLRPCFDGTLWRRIADFSSARELSQLSLVSRNVEQIVRNSPELRSWDLPSQAALSHAIEVVTATSRPVDIGRWTLMPIPFLFQGERSGVANTSNDLFTEFVQQHVDQIHSSAASANTGHFFMQLINSDLENLVGEERKNYIEKIETSDPGLITELIRKSIEQVLSGNRECPDFLTPYLSNFTTSYTEGFQGSPNYKQVTKTYAGLTLIHTLNDEQRKQAIDQIVGNLLKNANCIASLQKALESISTASSTPTSSTTSSPSSAPLTTLSLSSNSGSSSSAHSSSSTIRLPQQKEDPSESKQL